MKKILLVCCFNVMCIMGFSQNVPMPEPIMSKTDSIIEELVAMAMNNPSLRSTEHNALSAEYDYRRSKTGILNNLVVSGNLNEFTIKQTFGSDPTAQNRAIFFPRYNVGLSLPLGVFINNPKQTKSAYYRAASAYDQLEAERVAMRKQVQLAYYDYRMTKDLLTLQQAVVQDAKVLFLNQEKKFEDGLLTLDAYTAGSKIYNNELVKEITITRDLRVVESQLEALIGMKVDDALQQISIKAQSK